MGIKVFGITNCDSVKKTRKWLDNAKKPYDFVDFRKTAPKSEQIKAWVDQAGIDKVLNKRGTTWRKLTDEQKSITDIDALIGLMQEQPTLIKRPIVETDSKLLVGFDADQLTNNC